MNQLKSYLNQFEANLQELDIEYVEGIYDICEMELDRRAKLEKEPIVDDFDYSDELRELQS